MAISLDVIYNNVGTTYIYQQGLPIPILKYEIGLCNPPKERGFFMGASRFRNFATIVYPESAPEGWLDILDEECVEAFVSPLHDKGCKSGWRTEKSTLSC